MRSLISILFIIVSILGNSQETFHRIYNYNHPYSFAHGVYVTDSCYYFGVSEGEGVQVDELFGKMDLYGNIDFTSTNYTSGTLDMGFGGLTGLIKNHNENFVLGYTDYPWELYGLEVGTPKVVEFDSDGNLVNEFIFDFYQSDSLKCLDQGKILYSSIDSCYFGFFTYLDLTTDSNNPLEFDGESGGLLIKYNTNGTILWTKRFHHPNINIDQPYTASGMVFTDVEKLLLCIWEGRLLPSSLADQSSCRMKFIEVDLSGNIIHEWEFQDGEAPTPGVNIKPLNDGGYLYSYCESELTGSPPNSDYFWHRPVLTRLDSTFNLIWKKPIIDIFSNANNYGTINNYILNNDSVFTAAHSWYDIGPEFWQNDVSARIIQMKINGTELWHRDYHYFDLGDSSNSPEYVIKDLQATPDDGFILTGYVQNFDSIFAGAGGQYAYFLKTNCLGYLDNPIASFSYTVENNNTVSFLNNSVMNGNCTWIFGDGDTLLVSEHKDSINHNFQVGGEFNVTLIAEGCNGYKDTINTVVFIEDEPVDSLIMIGNGTLLTIYPNPVIKGESLSFFVGALPFEDVTFDLIDNSGRLIYSTLVESEKTYLIKANLSSGIYFASLKNNLKVIEADKVIIE